MKIAIIAITKHGVLDALRLKAALPEAQVWVSEKQKGPGQEGARHFGTIKDLAGELWDKVDGMVFHVSLGAVVRTIAPHLKSKDLDPAVVVVDDACRFAIPVLSGHVGGANELAGRVAQALGAQAVLTTASDARSTIPVDILGRELGWKLEGKENVTPVSAAVVNEKPVAFVREAGQENWWTRPTPLPANIRVFPSLAAALGAGEFEAYLVVSDRSSARLRAELGQRWDKAVLYRPPTLCLGMGCDHGTDLGELESLVGSSLEEAGLSPLSVAGLATIDLKIDEPCLLQLAAGLGVKLEAYTKDELNERKTKTMPNPLVMKYTGAVGVCEPAAMLLAGVGDLVLEKRKSRRATLAVARKG